MNLKNQNFEIDCSHCKFESADESSDFRVTVPISDIQDDINGLATLKCTVNTNSHHILLTKLIDISGNRVKINENCQYRLKEALDFIGEKQICGNKNICPTSVIKFVNNK